MSDISPKKPMVSIIIPTFQSSKHISTTIERTVAAMEESNYEFEILIIDDGSSDDTWGAVTHEATKTPKVSCYQLERNYGQHAATLCGLRNALGDFIVTMDDDLQHNPTHIRKLVDHLISEDLDLVIAEFNAVEKSFIRKLGTITVNRFVSRSLGKSRVLKLSAFRAFTKNTNMKVIATKNPKPYITGELLLASTRIRNLKLEHEKRHFGNSTYTVKSLIKLFVRITLNYSLLPLRLLTRTMYVLIVSTIGLQIYGIDTDFLVITWIIYGLLAISVITKYVEKLFLNVVFPVQYKVKNAQGSKKARKQESKKARKQESKMTLNLKITYKTWDSEFFNRDIYELTGVNEIGSVAVGQLGEMLDQVITNERAIVQTSVTSEYFSGIPALEGAGFRFVDSRLEFLTTEERLVKEVSAPTGLFRDFHENDWDELSELTFQSFASNTSFMSRYNNRNYFSVEDSHRYYMQWHKLVLENQNPMFCIWDVSGEICGFYTIVRKFDVDTGMPFYKVGLAAVKEGHRSFGAQNLMQQWLFSRAIDPKWVTVNSPALTNKEGIKNNIRAQKNFDRAEVFMFANRGSMNI